MNIEWSDQSRADLTAIHAFIARDSEFYADRMVQRIILRAERILNHPLSGHLVHEYPEEILKEVHEKPYRIIYRPSDSNVEIVTIIHFRQVLKKEKLP